MNKNWYYILVGIIKGEIKITPFLTLPIMGVVFALLIIPTISIYFYTQNMMISIISYILMICICAKIISKITGEI